MPSVVTTDSSPNRKLRSMAEQAIQIGELSRRTGCNIETIRYYERIGLMPPPPRRGRYRSYDGEHVGRLGFVRRARELGFTLDEVRALLGLAGGGQSSSSWRMKLSRLDMSRWRSACAPFFGRLIQPCVLCAWRAARWRIGCPAGIAPGLSSCQAVGLGESPIEPWRRAVARY